MPALGALLAEMAPAIIGGTGAIGAWLWAKHIMQHAHDPKA